MRGQTSAEMLILLGAILLTVTSLVYAGGGRNEIDVVKSAARSGADNAIAALDAEYGCTINIEKLSFDAGTITISVNVMGGPPPDNQTIRDGIRVDALKFISQAIDGTFPENTQLVKTRHYTYDVMVEVRRVTR